MRLALAWVYTTSPHAIGSHAGYIPPPLMRLVLTLGIQLVPARRPASHRLTSPASRPKPSPLTTHAIGSHAGYIPPPLM
eukprot:1194448-Prorocentrum_minimum.AAC.2